MTGLDREARSRLRADGWCLRPGAVSPALVRRARREVLRDLGTRGLPPDQLKTFLHQSFCPELRAAPSIMALLFDSELWPLAEALFGEGQVARPTRAQIALRFPVDELGAPAWPHLDGRPTVDNGGLPGQLSPFTALFGVYLTSVSGIGEGGFTVWPGTHEAYAARLRSAGVEALLDGEPEIDLPTPEVVTGEPGDAFVVHPLLGHAGGQNWGSSLRIAVYFRLRLAEYSRRAPPVDLWRDWPGLGAAGSTSC